MGGMLSAEPKQGTDGLSELPDDVLTTILGFLDLRTLCTARFVCKRFRKFAGEQFKALDCRTLEKPPTTDFTEFLGMTHLAVTISQESHLQFLAHPWITPVVTHVSLKGFHLLDRQSAEELEAALLSLPKLRSVSLQPLGGAVHFQPLGGNLHLPLFPPQLEELKITGRHSLDHVQWPGVGDASPLTRYSRLTSLAIDVVPGAEPSLGSLSSLRNLRSLDLRSCPPALSLLSTFTALTSLTFNETPSWAYFQFFQDLGRLTGLSRLALTRSQTPRAVEHADLACIAQLTNLTCLDMTGCWLRDSAQRSTALAPLTRLADVSLNEAKAGALVSSLRVTTLHSLTLWDVTDISLLQRAIRLSHADMHCRIPMHCSSRPVLAGMSRLRSLSLFIHKFHGGPQFRLDAILRTCTMLTKLDYGGGDFRPEKDLKACAALPGLRSLTFSWISELTRACFPALQAMSGLTELSLLSNEIYASEMTPAVIAAFDAERLQMGWPALKLRVEGRGGRRRFERL